MTTRIRHVEPPDPRLRLRARWDGDGRIVTYEIRLPEGTVLTVDADDFDRDLVRARDRAAAEYKNYKR
jgi:hypothetical protein